MKVNEIRMVGIAGAGTMGASMAQIFAEKGYDVVVYDAFEEGLRRGEHLVEVNQASLVSSGALTQAQSDAIRARLQTAPPFTRDCHVKQFDTGGSPHDQRIKQEHRGPQGADRAYAAA